VRKEVWNKTRKNNNAIVVTFTVDDDPWQQTFSLIYSIYLLCHFFSASSIKTDFTSWVVSFVQRLCLKTFELFILIFFLKTLNIERLLRSKYLLLQSRVKETSFHSFRLTSIHSWLIHSCSSHWKLYWSVRQVGTRFGFSCFSQVW
jgi:hypothetical protein